MATVTPNYGWSVPTSTDYVKDGASAIETLGDSVDSTLYTINGGSALTGLHLINSTVVSAQSSVTINSVFSATYDAYRVVISNVSMSAANNLILRLGASTTGYYFCELSGGGNYSGTAASAGNGANQNQYTTGIVTDTTNRTGGWIEIQNPFLAQTTSIQSQGSDTRTTGSGTRIVSGFHNVTTSYTGLFIGMLSGTFSGTVSVYGYRD